MFTPIRSVLAVLEEGGVNRAARRLGIPQPTISRQIQSLEQEFGAPLFERGPMGMRPTDLGFFVRDQFSPLLRNYELARAETLAFAQGRHQQLRIGFIGLAASKYLNVALARLKREFPDVRLMLFDQTPAEQLEGLRAGRIDVALVGQEIARRGEEFYARRIAQLKVAVALPADHRMANHRSVSLADLKGERFVTAADTAVPGRAAWTVDLCVKAGYKPKIIAKTENVSETFGLVTGEGAVTLLPDYLDGLPPPGVAFVRLSDAWATWSLHVLRQRGRGSPAARRLFEVIGRPGDSG